MEVQSVLISKEFYSLQNAEAWIKINKYKPIQNHENKYYYIFKIREPFSKYSFRNNEINTKGIYVDYII